MMVLKSVDINIRKQYLLMTEKILTGKVFFSLKSGSDFECLKKK